MTKTSRLWRRLGATQPMFRLSSPGNFDLDDHAVTEVNISRGTSGPDAGVYPHTMSFGTTEMHYIATQNRTVTCDLTPYGQQLLSDLTNANRALIARRFHGRIGKQSINDITTERQPTTYDCASWVAQLNNTATGRNHSAGELVADWLRRLSTPGSGTGIPSSVRWNTPAPLSQYGTIAESSADPVTYPDAVNTWTADIGLYVQTKRDGTSDVLTHEYRWAQATSRMAAHTPITRSAAISPATWDQPVENITPTHSVTWRQADRFFTQYWGFDSQNTNIPVIDHDMSHVMWTSNQNQPEKAGRAFWQRDIVDRYRLPSLTFDLLYLLNSPYDSHRAQARQILELEVGDPMFFSGDWSGYYRGVHYITGVDESISPDGWDFTISLAQAHEVVGETSPRVPAKTWESATHPWSEADGTWATP